MSKGLTLLKQGGQLLPTGLLAKAVNAFNTCAGLAYVVPGSGHVTVLHQTDVPAELKVVQQTQETLKDRHVVYSFQTFDSEFLNDDCMPIVVLKNGDKNSLVAFVEGDFSPYLRRESRHTAHFHYVTSYLIPKMQRMLDAYGGDLDKLMKELEQPIYRDELLNVAIPVGSLVLIAANDQVKVFQKNPAATIFDFGWASDDLGFKAEYQKTVKASSATQPATAASGLAAVFAEKIAESKSGDTSKTEGKPGGFREFSESAGSSKTVDADKTDQTSTETSETGWRTVTGRCPSQITGKKAIRRWYEVRSDDGQAPNKYGERPEITYQVKEHVINGTKTTSVRPMSKADAGLKAAGTTPTSVPVIPAPDQQTETTDEPHPFLDDKIAVAIIDDFLNNPEIMTIIDSEGRPAEDPKKMEEPEEVPELAGKLGLSGTHIFMGFKMPQLLDFARKYPDASAILNHNVLASYDEALDLLDEKDEEIKTLKAELLKHVQKPESSAATQMRRRVAGIKS